MEGSALASPRNLESRKPAPVVHIVADDVKERQSLRGWVLSFQLTPKEHEPTELLGQRFDSRAPGCVLLGMRSSSALNEDEYHLLQNVPTWVPTIVVTTRDDVPLAVQAMKAGAVDVLQRPLDQRRVRDAVLAAIDLDTRRRIASGPREEVRARYRTLTEREHEVLHLVVDGQSNKCIAAHLHLSQKTVEVHRAHVMKKMQANSVAALVRMYVLLAGSNDLPATCAGAVAATHGPGTLPNTPRSAG